MNCVEYGKSFAENILSSCNSFSASTNPLVNESAYILYSSRVRFNTSFFLQLTVPPFLYVERSVHAVKKSVADMMDNKSPFKYFIFLSSQSFLSSKSSIANIAVTSSNTVSDTPPVLTFSNT